jgi:hypothetical protein
MPLLLAVSRTKAATHLCSGICERSIRRDPKFHHGRRDQWPNYALLEPGAHRVGKVAMLIAAGLGDIHDKLFGASQP